MNIDGEFEYSVGIRHTYHTYLRNICIFMSGVE